MSFSSLFLSFPAALLPGMEQASIIRTENDAYNALTALTDRDISEGAIASVSESALRIPIWGGKNAGRESRFALECGKQLHKLIDCEITDVVTCGNSAAISKGYELETSAATDGWHLFNIFGLPYTLESAAAHTISVAVAARGARLALSSGEGSGLAALQLVENLLVEDACRTIIWGTTEQFSEGAKAVLSTEKRGARSRNLKKPRLHFEGSILFAVTSTRTNVSAFEVIELRNLRSPDDFRNRLGINVSPQGRETHVCYVNFEATPASFPAGVLPEHVVNLHDQFGDGLSMNPFLPFLDMLTRPSNCELLIVLSDGCARWQLLRAVRLIDG